MQRHWYALYVKSRHEFLTYNELMKKGIIAYLPYVKKLRQWKDRKKYVNFPLFPGYLFVHIEPVQKQFLSVVKTPGVVRLLSYRPGYPIAVSSDEINSLKIMLESGRKIDIFPHLKEGMQVRVRRGPLKGAVGTLLRKEEDYMIFVNIELLGRSVGVRIYSDDVESA